MITVHALEKKFGQLEVLKRISVTFDKPGITAILGPNGSGKTTLIKTILGMVLPSKGDVLFNGRNIKNQYAYRHQIDYLPQIARFPENLTVQELLSMIKDIRGNEPTRKEDLIQLFELQPYLNKKLGSLSGGTRQKVNILQAFMYDSPVMILDEPTNGLDPVAMIRLRSLLAEEKQKGKLILMTTHIMHFVEEMADEVIFLLEGNIYYKGTVENLKAIQHKETLEAAIATILQPNLKEANRSIYNGTAIKYHATHIKKDHV